MKIYRFCVLFAFIAIAGMTVVSRPEWLAENAFLKAFITHELIAVLVVILIITFASVANIHLSLNRIAKRAKGRYRERVDSIRGKINADAWLIFWAFIVCVIALIVKGAHPLDTDIVAAAHAVGLAVLLLNVLAMHTIYRSIFALVAVENLIGENGGNGSHEGQDFTKESPPTQSTE